MWRRRADWLWVLFTFLSAVRTSDMTDLLIWSLPSLLMLPLRHSAPCLHNRERKGNKGEAVESNHRKWKKAAKETAASPILTLMNISQRLSWRCSDESLSFFICNDCSWKIWLINVTVQSRDQSLQHMWKEVNECGDYRAVYINLWSMGPIWPTEPMTVFQNNYHIIMLDINLVFYFILVDCLATKTVNQEKYYIWLSLSCLFYNELCGRTLPIHVVPESAPANNC